MHPQRPGAPRTRPRRRATGLSAVLLLVVSLLAACGGDAPQETATGAGSPTGAAATPAGIDPADWEAVLERARGQTVRWWLFGGDELVNQYVDEVVAPTAQEDLGITVERVPVDDTAAAVQRVLAEKRAGQTEDGSVDLIWLNGENFAQGKRADLWLEDWSRDLPNAERYVDLDDPTITTDFGVPVDGQEAPWSRAAFIFAYDTDRIDQPPRTFGELLGWAEDNPGRFTYPAPPNFTGSAFVRLAVQALGEDEAFRLLQELKPHQWREGQAFPENGAELAELFGNDQVDLAMSYDPSFVRSNVNDGTFPESARPYVLETGTLQNVSYVTIPANAAHRAGALALANLLLRPDMQASKADPEGLSVPTVLDLQLLEPEQRELFEQATGGPYVLGDYGEVLRELPADRVPELEERWQNEVLRP